MSRLSCASDGISEAMAVTARRDPWKVMRGVENEGFIGEDRCEYVRMNIALFKDQGDDVTLNTTALVHEVYLAIAARATRQVLIGYARARSSLKRGGGLDLLPLDENIIMPSVGPDELIALDEALERAESFGILQRELEERLHEESQTNHNSCIAPGLQSHERPHAAKSAGGIPQTNGGHVSKPLSIGNVNRH